MLKPKMYQWLKNVFEKLLFLCAGNKHAVEEIFDRKKYYNDQYKNQERFWWKEPSELLINSLEHLPKGGHILDLGCGEWQDAVYLASKWFQITAIDTAEAGLKKIKQHAIEGKLPIRTICTDIKTHITSDEINKFDGIICMNSLQFLNQKDVWLVLNSIQQKTKSWGLNIIESFIAETETHKKKIIAQERYFFDEGELRKRYENDNRDIITYKERYGQYHSHGWEPEHRHYHVRLVAKKK